MLDDDDEDDLLFQDAVWSDADYDSTDRNSDAVWYDDTDALSSVDSVSTAGWTAWEYKNWRCAPP